MINRTLILSILTFSKIAVAAKGDLSQNVESAGAMIKLSMQGILKYGAWAAAIGGILMLIHPGTRRMGYSLLSGLIIVAVIIVLKTNYFPGISEAINAMLSGDVDSLLTGG